MQSFPIETSQSLNELIIAIVDMRCDRTGSERMYSFTVNSS